MERHRRWIRRAAQREPGWDYDWQRDRFVIWEETARSVFDEEAEEHRQRCEEIAARLARLDPAAQLFGRDDPGTVRQDE